MKSFSGGMQIYYHCGQPAVRSRHPFGYVVHLHHGGKYELTMKYVSVKPDQRLNLVVNQAAAPIVINVPWTDGNWAAIKPVAIELRRGRDTLSFDRGKMTGFEADGIYALSIKKFVLTPAGHR